MEETITYSPCPPPGEPFVRVIEDGFGFVTGPNGNGEIVRRYTFTNQNDLTIQVITYGATITSIKYPDNCGVIEDVALGFDHIEGYVNENNPYMGAIVGRCANRIAKGHFKLLDDDYQLTINAGEHHLHGGFKGFDKVNWKSDLQGDKLVLTHLSKDGEEGYPGEVLVSITYQMTTDNRFLLDMKATTSKPTPINLTNHTYFNLAGHGAGAKAILEHLVCINADRFVSTDENFIPTGCLQNVTGTIWDLRIPRKLESVLKHVPYGGYDTCMCIHKTDSECMTFNARVVHPETGRTLEIYSNQPGVQFYTANQFPKSLIHGVPVDEGGGTYSKTEPYPRSQGYKGKEWSSLLQELRILSGDPKLSRRGESCKFDSFVLMEIFGNLDNEEENVCPIRICPICGYVVKDPDFENPPDDCCSEEGVTEGRDKIKIVRLIGKDDVEYFYRGAISLMTEKYPDSVHRKNFPTTIVRPGEMYRHIVHYKFGLFEEVNLEPEDNSAPIDEWEGEGEEYFEENDDLLETKLEENGR